MRYSASLQRPWLLLLLFLINSIDPSIQHFENCQQYIARCYLHLWCYFIPITFLIVTIINLIIVSYSLSLSWLPRHNPTIIIITQTLWLNIRLLRLHSRLLIVKYSWTWCMGLVHHITQRILLHFCAQLLLAFSEIRNRKGTESCLVLESNSIFFFKNSANTCLHAMKYNATLNLLHIWPKRFNSLVAKWFEVPANGITHKN